MGTVERSPFANVPNDRLKTLAEKRSAAPAAGVPTVHPANERINRGDPGSSSPMSRMASPVKTPDNRFSVGDAKMPQPPSASMPGPGMIPVDLRSFNPMAQGLSKMDNPKGKMPK